MLIEPQPDYPEFQKRPDDDFTVIAPRIAIYDGDRYYRKKTERYDYGPLIGVLFVLVTGIASIVGVWQLVTRVLG